MSAVKTIADREAAQARSEVSKSEPYTIRCYVDIAISLRTRRTILSLLADQALRLLTRLDTEIMESRADWNQDRFRRVMQVRRKAVSRVLRRWTRINPPPALSPGSLRRRYHANLAGHLYEPRL